MSYKIYSDGCHFKEFNAAGIGGYFLKDDETVFEFSEKIIEPKNFDIHERVAVIKALEKGIELGWNNEEIQYFSDDRALMEMLEKPRILLDANVESLEENRLVAKLFGLRNQYTNIVFNYIPRSENKHADKLSRKTLEEDLFSDRQIVEKGFYNPKFISKNNYPKGETLEFNHIKEKINSFLVVHSYTNKDLGCANLDVYYAQNVNENITYELVESSNLELKGWHKSAVNNVVKHLNVLSEKNKEVCLVLHDEYIILDQMFRGRREITTKLKPAFDNLDIVLECLDKVVVHRDPLVYQAIFQDNPYKMLPKKDKKLKNKI